MLYMKSSAKIALLMGSFLLLSLVIWGLYDENTFRKFFWMKIYENRTLILFIVLGIVISVFGIKWIIKNRKRPPKKQRPVFAMPSQGGSNTSNEKKLIKVSNRSINWYEILKGVGIGVSILAIIGVIAAVYSVRDRIEWWGWPAITFISGLIICIVSYRKAFRTANSQKEEEWNDVLNKARKKSFDDLLKELWKKKAGKLFFSGCVLLIAGIVWILIELIIRGIKHPFTQVYWPVLLGAATLAFIWWARKKPEAKVPKWFRNIAIFSLIFGLGYEYFVKPERTIKTQLSELSGEVVAQSTYDSLELKQRQDSLESQITIRQLEARYQSLENQLDSAGREASLIKVSSDQARNRVQQLQQEKIILENEIKKYLRTDSANNVALTSKDQALKEKDSKIQNLEVQFSFAGKQDSIIRHERDSLKDENFKKGENIVKLQQQLKEKQSRNSSSEERKWTIWAVILSLLLFIIAVLLFVHARKAKPQEGKGEQWWRIPALVVGSILLVGIGWVVFYLFTPQTTSKDWKKEKEQLTKKYQNEQNKLKDSVETLNQQLAKLPQNKTVVDTSGVASLRQERDSLNNLLKNDSITKKLTEAQETIKVLEKKLEQKTITDTTVVAKTPILKKRKNKETATVQKKEQIRITSIAEPTCCAVSGRENRKW